ncbi:polyprotein of EF-Ts, chloroplastic isoform X2 [Spinacia oleracea]|uniref:Elongation factor Ts, mitochondrial n=1 Tax=Spinacia oleracea TaxID=3562 RepID=A0A9R0KBT2_SPIOL|nr:polyprotein of EF-Ts, chloroplastic isoform X2 [Spinacia oleracea]
MTPVIPCSVSNISFIPGNAFTTRKSRCFTRFSGNLIRPSLSSQKHFIAIPKSITVFQQLKKGCSRVQRLSATGTDVAVEEQGSSVADEASAGPPAEVETNVEPSTKSEVTAAPTVVKRRQGRRSEMPPVKDEDLVTGAKFAGKVRSIQPFGAFVDFGAFTDGLVHVSQLSASFVKDVNDVVSIGQEVQVRLLEVNTETRRISLSMREDDSSNKPQQKNDGNSDSARPPRSSNRSSQKRENVKKTKFVQGQDLVGTVKNFARSGAFVSLPEGEEGFLPTAEEPDDGFGNVMGNTSLEVGQEVNVRVLRISRGIVTLTMKKAEDVNKLDSKLNQGVVHEATNPFVVAFRRNKDIAAFLDEREKPEEDASAETLSTDASEVSSVDVASPSLEEKAEDLNSEEVATTSQEDAPVVEDEVTAPISADDGETNVASSVSQDVVAETQPEVVSAKEDIQVDIPADEANQSVNASSAEDEGTTPIPPSAEDGETETEVSSLSQEVVVETQAEDVSAKEEVPVEIPTDAASAETTSSDANGSINGSSDGPNGSSPQGSASKAISPALVKQLREETGAGMMDCKKALSETGGDIVKALEFLRKKGLASADKKSSRTTAEGRIGSYIHDSRIGVLIEVNCETDFVSRGDIFRELVDDLAMQVAACPQVEYLSTDDVPKEFVDKETEIEMQKEDLLSKPEQIRSKIVEGRVNKRLVDLALLEQPFIKDDKVVVKDWVKQTIATIGENIKVNRFVRYNLGEGLQKKSQDFAAEVAAQTAAKSTPVPEKEQPAAAEIEKPVEKAPAVAVSAALVKQLREETGAGMMDCKKALAETGGDLEQAQEYLRKKGLSSAEKKSSRIAAEGRIGSYVHDTRIGVLLEINCETDFVGRSEKFKELVDDLAMQVAACPRVEYVSVEDIPESIVSKEKEIEMQREDILSKPENIREKIVEGRISKRLGELALSEQPFIKDDSIMVKDLVKQTVAALGENIKVRRFTRYTLGEKIESSNTETEA